MPEAAAQPGVPRDRLPRAIRLALGATGRGIGEDRLRRAVAGQVILVTGASSGIGEASARRLGSAGATVLLVARSEGRLSEIAEQINGGVGATRAHVHPCDLSDLDACGALAQEVLESHGHIDVVVSNAGMSIRRFVSESYERFKDYERTAVVNYLGPVRLLLGLLPSMRARRSGHIVNVATMGVDFPGVRWGAYISSKTAFEAWLRALAPEVRAEGLTITSIHMQLVRSPMLGPYRMFSYMPGMSVEEAAGMVARGVADRPRVIAPPWARVMGAVNAAAQEPFEAALAGLVESGRSGRPPAPVRAVGAPVRLLSGAAGSAQTIAATGLVRPVRPDRLARAGVSAARLGGGPAAALAAAAALHPDRLGVIDEHGSLTFGELDQRSARLAAALRAEHGLAAGRRIGVLCRNHRGFVEAAAAAGRLGCDLIPLGTDFAGPQLGDVLRREDVVAAIHDVEFAPIFDAAGFEGLRVHADADADADADPDAGAAGRGPGRRPSVESLIATGGPSLGAPDEPGRVVMLTSGTTGTPKGAHRTMSGRGALTMGAAAFLDLARLRPVPRAGEPWSVAPPLYHLYGQIGLVGAFAMGSPIVIRRRFEAKAVLAGIEAHHCGTLLGVPTMLARIMDLGDEVIARHDLSSLRVIISGAAPLAPELATRVMDAFGEILFNGYASTEVGAGTIATPRDLRAAPGTVGRPVAGVRIRILDEQGREVSRGQTGRIFVSSPMLFDGYSGGGSKELIDGYMSTGDVGHFDRAGRLFVDGRDDDMILSGGENVYPQEVEELLLTHDAVTDAAVRGVPDPDFGQRLEALVVLRDHVSVTEDALRAHVRDHLARHKVPRDIRFVESLPRTSTGKLQRRRLIELPA